MGTTTPQGRITRRRFLERSAAALASTGLIANAYGAKSELSSDSTAGLANSNAVPLVGKIALEEHFVLPAGLSFYNLYATFTSASRVKD